MQNVLVIDHLKPNLLVKQLQILNPTWDVAHASDYHEVLQALQEADKSDDIQIDLLIINMSNFDESHLDPIALLLVLKLSGKLRNAKILALFDFPCNLWLTRSAQTAGAHRVEAYPWYAKHIKKLSRKILLWNHYLGVRGPEQSMNMFYRFGLSEMPHEV